MAKENKTFDAIRSVPEPQIPRQADAGMQVYVRQLHDWVKMQLGVLTPKNITEVVRMEGLGALLHSDFWNSVPPADYDGDGYELSTYTLVPAEFEVGDLLRATIWGTISWEGFSDQQTVEFKVGEVVVGSMVVSTGSADGSVEFFLQAVLRGGNTVWGVVSGDGTTVNYVETADPYTTLAVNYVKDAGSVGTLAVSLSGYTIERVPAPRVTTHAHTEPEGGGGGDPIACPLTNVGMDEELTFTYTEGAGEEGPPQSRTVTFALNDDSPSYTGTFNEFDTISCSGTTWTMIIYMGTWGGYNAKFTAPNLTGVPPTDPSAWTEITELNPPSVTPGPPVYGGLS